MKDFDLLEIENQLWQQQNYNPLHRPMITVDHNWEALKDSQHQKPQKAKVKIDRLSNLSIVLYNNSLWKRGQINFDVYRNKIKQQINKNFTFETKAELTPSHYKVWDLIITDSVLSNCQARRAKIYDRNQPDSYTNEYSYFEIWRNNDLIWAAFLIEDYILPLRIELNDQFYKMTAAWKTHCHIDQWYRNNI